MGRSGLVTCTNSCEFFYQLVSRSRLINITCLLYTSRSVLLVGRIEGEPDLRAVVQIKNNLAAFGHSKAFRLTETGFEWIGDYEITADEVLGGIAPKVNKLEQAKKMLRELAETSTSVQSSEIFDMAEDLNISKRTLENAKKELEIKARRIGNSWYWDLDKVKPE